MSGQLHLDGVAWWTPSLPSWTLAHAALRGESMPDAAAAPAPTRPAPALLAANERRRAPDSVLLALHVAHQAATESGHDRATLASVFASTHGDLPITDALCRTLASNPLLLSPTRFHHSVHNAASGYWAMGSGSGAASTALSAGEHTFAAAWVEAASQCHSSGQAVMLVHYDTEACGALLSVNRSRGLLALALVLSPVRGPQSRFALRWRLQNAAVARPVASSQVAQGLASNASALALPLMEALALGTPTTLRWPLSRSLALQIELDSLPPTKANAAAA